MEVPRSVDMQPVGGLHLFSSDQGPEKDFLLYPGQNMIGRRPDCTVILPFPSISKVHAVIEIPAEGRAPFVRDCRSLNGTYFVRPLRRLRPGKNHQLNDKDGIIFADLPCQFHYLGAPPIVDPTGAIEVEDIPSVPVIREPPLQETSLTKDSKEEGDHGVRAFLPGKASDLQPGSPEKATSSRRQATDNPKTELKGQSVQSDMDNQDQEDSSNVTFVSSKTPGSEAPAPAWSPRPTWKQKKTTSKRVHSSSSPDSQASPCLGWGQEIKTASGKQSGRGQGLVQAPNIEPLLLQDSRDKSGSSFQRETQEPFSSSSAPTTSMAAELHPAIPKELPRRTESHQQTPKRQKQGAPRKQGSTPVVPVLPLHPRERSEILKELPRTFQSQRVGVGKTGESLTVIPKPSSSLTAQKPAPQTTGSQSMREVGIPGSTQKSWPKLQMTYVTGVTNEPSPSPKKQGREKTQKRAAREKENIKPVEVETARPSSQREKQDHFSSPSAPATSLATELHPAINKELRRRTESHKQTPKRQKQGAPRKQGSTPVVPVFPPDPRERSETLKEPCQNIQSHRAGVGKTGESLTVIPKPSTSLTADKPTSQATGSQSEKAGGIAGSTWKFQPRVPIQHLKVVTKEPSPCPKEKGRGQPQKLAAREKENVKPVEVETEVKTPKGGAELTIQPKEKVKGMPHQSVREPSLDEEKTSDPEKLSDLIKVTRCMMEAPRSVDMQPVGRLHLITSDRGPEKDFLLYPGWNTIGRRPDCTVILPFPSISKVHAVIEIPAEGMAPFVQDCRSLNGTFFVRPLRRLRPGKKNQLNDKDGIIFADLPCQFHYLGAPPLLDPEGALEVEEIPSVPVMGEPPLQGTSLAKDWEEEGDHGVPAFLLGTASDLQPGSPEKATTSRSQATDNPKTELKGQSVQSDMDNQDEKDSPDLIFVSYKAPGCESRAPASSPRPTSSQKKRTYKRVHFSPSPDSRKSPRLGEGREIKRARGMQSGRGHDLLQAPNIEPFLPQDTREKSGSSSQRESKDPFSSSSAPTTSMAAKLHPAIPKELSIRRESHQETLKGQKPGATSKHVSAPVVPVFPVHPRERSETLIESPRIFQRQREGLENTCESLTVIPKSSTSLTADKPTPQTTGSQSEKAGGIAGSTWKFQPRVPIQHLTVVTKEPSPCPKEKGRGQPQKLAAREKENVKPVEVETEVKKPKGGAELTIQPKEKVKGMPHQSVGKSSHDEEMIEPPRSVDMQPVGRLHLITSEQGPEKDFLLYPGQNTIGRRPDCTVILPFPSVSKVHAVIEIPTDGRAPFVQDCRSLNGTFFVRPLRHLRPGKNHQLNDKDGIIFADLPCQFHYLGAPPLLDPEGAIEVEEIPSVPVMGEPPLLGTSLAKDCKEEGDHGVHAFLPGTASDLQPGSQEKATSSRSQATDDPDTEIKGQSVQSDMDNQDEEDSPDVNLGSDKAPDCEPRSPASSPRPTRSQKKRTYKWVHFSPSPDSRKSPRLGEGREIKRARGMQSGRGHDLLQAPNIEPFLPQDTREKSGSSSQRESKDPFSSSSAPTTSMAAKLHPAIPKELSIRRESHQETLKGQKPGATSKHVSAPVVPVFPGHLRERFEALKEPPRIFQRQRVGLENTGESLTVIPKPSTSLTADKPTPQATGSLSEKAGGIAGSTLKFQPRVPIQHLTVVTKEPSPCPKEQSRGQPQKRAAREKVNVKPVEVKTEVKTPKGGAELTIQPKEKVKEMPHQSVGRSILDEQMMEPPRSVDMQPVGRLHLITSEQGPEKDFLLYPGWNTIGRRPDCTVILPFPSISKLHAVIEIPTEGRAPLVHDCRSLNGTFFVRPLRRLRPGKNHQLNDKDGIIFADLPCQFHYLGAPLLPDPEGAIEVEEIPSVPVMGDPPLQGTLLAKNSEEEGEHLEKDQHLTGGDGDNKTDVHDKGSPKVQLPPEDGSGSVQMEGTIKKVKTKDHGVCAFLPGTSSDLQPGSPEKATSSRSQATDNPDTEIKGQSVQSDMDNQDEEDSPDVFFVSYKTPGCELGAPAWSPRPAWRQKKRTSKRVHFSPSPDSQKSPRLGRGREIKRARGKQSGRGQGLLQAPNIEPLLPQYSRDKSGSSFHKETQEHFSSSSAPTTSMAAELHPAFPKELQRRTESHQQTLKGQKPGATSKHVSSPVVPFSPGDSKERSETLKEPPQTFQSQRIGLENTGESLTVILKPYSSLTAQKPALQATGSQRENEGGILVSSWKLQPRVQLKRLTIVTNEPSPCPKEQGRGQPQKCAASEEEDDKPVKVATAGSSSERETQEPFSSSSAPTTSLAAALHSAIAKELPRRTESHQQTPKKQKQGATRKQGSARVVPVFPAHPRERSEPLKEPPTTFQSQRVGLEKTGESLAVIIKPSTSLTTEKPALQGTGSLSKKAGGIAGSTWKVQPRAQIEPLTLVTNEPSPCPKEQGRGQPQKRAASKEEDKPVEVGTAVKTPKGGVELKIQPKEEVRRMPHQSVGQPSLDEEVRALPSGREIRMKSEKLRPTAQEEAEGEQGGKAPDDHTAESMPETSD